MSQIQFLIDRFEEMPDATAIICREETITYGDLIKETNTALEQLKAAGLDQGDVVILYGDYSPTSIAVLLALSELSAIIIPLTAAAEANVAPTLPKACANWRVDVSEDVIKVIAVKVTEEDPELYEHIRNARTPGLVLFTSGSSGVPKAVVHDFSRLLKKFHKRRPALITINFLLFDHWGGLNTLLHCLSNQCLIVIPAGRTPEQVCKMVEDHKIELLPTTPSFLNMLVISGAHSRYDLSSLKIISYGAEPMSSSTLERVHQIFPDVDLRQTYGMIELGVLRAKSRSADSLWMKMGGEGYDLRVVDGLLQIKAQSAMLGYINAPSPYTDDGYFMTGDRVEVDGEWLRVLGRESDLINVGGQKVYPSEVETTLLSHDIVEDALVRGEDNKLLGKIVIAFIVLNAKKDKSEARKLLIQHCKQSLADFMIPARFKFVREVPLTARGKRDRRQSARNDG